MLFADIVDSSAMVGGKDPEDANDEILLRLQSMIDAVHRFDGTVTQFQGDGILAMFGAPLAQEHHALMACLAAAAIHAPDATEEPVRVGLDSGVVVASLVNNDISHEFRAAGETVHVAARMHEFAPPGATMLTERTLRLVADHVEVGPLADYQLSENAAPVRYCQLLDVDRTAPPFRHLRQRRLGALIGRDRELTLLKHAATDALAGRGRFVVVRGDPGIGKTRLVFEFLEALRGDEWGIVECNFRPRGLARPLESIACVVRGAFGLGASAGKGNVQAGLARLGITQEDDLDIATALLDEHHAPACLADLDPADALRRRVDVATRLVLAAARERPHVIVLEDLHWADAEARAFVEALAAAIATTPLLVLGTVRDYHNGLTLPAGRHISECPLRHFTLQECEQFLGTLLGTNPALAELRALLIHKTQGNPFFLEESVRGLRDNGALAGQLGSITLMRPVVELEVPDTVLAVIAARIDALSGDQKTLLSHAAVLGQTFDIGILRDLAKITKEQLFLQLERLQLTGFVERTRIVPNMEYSFRHALIHDVAYATLLRRKRKELHGHALAVIRRRPRDRVHGRTQLLAHHAHAAGASTTAYVHGRAAGLDSQAKSKNQDARDHLVHSLAGLRKCRPTLRNRRAHVDVRVELAQSLYALGQHKSAHRHLESARREANSLDDAARLGKVRSNETLHYWIRGKLTLAIKSEKAALGIAHAQDDRGLEISSATRLGVLLADHGRYRQAHSTLTNAYDLMPANARQSRYGMLASAACAVLAPLALCSGELGRFREAVKIGDEAVSISLESGHGFSRVYSSLHAGTTLIRKGEFEAAVPMLEGALATCRETNSDLLRPWCIAAVGYAKVRTGQSETGISLLDEAAAEAEDRAVAKALTFFWLADAQRALGRLASARRAANKALALAEENEERGQAAWATWLLGELALCETRRPGASSAEAHLRRALSIANASGMRPLGAHCHHGLAKLCWNLGSVERAHKHLRHAMSGFEEMTMRGWLVLGRQEWADLTTTHAAQQAQPIQSDASMDAQP